jgi:Ca2+/Na+ antiporter
MLMTVAQDFNIVAEASGSVFWVSGAVLLISLVGMIYIFIADRGSERGASNVEQGGATADERRMFNIGLYGMIGVLLLTSFLNITGPPAHLVGLIVLCVYAVWLWFALVKK